MYDVVVIGAGPAGCRTAELVAKKGFNIALLEEHDDVGVPVQCAGLISHRLKALVPDLPDDVFINEVSRAKFFSPSAKNETDHSIELQSTKPVYVTDRERLDKALLERARAAGAKAARSTRFINFSIKNDENKTIIFTSKGKVESKLLVGADGPNSLVAKRANLLAPQNHLTGVQATAEGEFDPGAVELWFGSAVAPEFFAWLIPLSADKARIGLATKNRALEYYKKFMEKRLGKAVKPDVAGRINFGLMDNTAAERVMVVGDAACQIKPFSGGGVIYGLIGAGYCANACIRTLQKNDFSAGFLKREYDEKWRWQLEKPIKRGLLYRKILLGSDKRMNMLFKIGKYAKFVLESFDMDLL